LLLATIQFQSFTTAIILDFPLSGRSFIELTMSLTYENPILPGFYPDPCIVRVDDTFYLITSSFQFFPGLPIHKSKDLINWELVGACRKPKQSPEKPSVLTLVAPTGNAINRPSQLSLQHATTKANNLERREIFTGGIYAPTMRFHSGTFYIVCTNLTGSTSMAPEVDFEPNTNFLITCDDLTDPTAYSDPMPFDFYGIDPDLFFDDDGKVYMTGSFIHGYRKKPQTVIRQAEIDLTTGKLVTEARDVWTGTGGNCPEGPRKTTLVKLHHMFPAPRLTRLHPNRHLQKGRLVLSNDCRRRHAPASHGHNRPIQSGNGSVRGLPEEPSNHRSTRVPNHLRRPRGSR
jgi:beta-xylosidase